MNHKLFLPHGAVFFSQSQRSLAQDFWETLRSRYLSLLGRGSCDENSLTKWIRWELPQHKHMRYCRKLKKQVGIAGRLQ